MKRLLKSIIGGILIPFTLACAGFLAESWIDLGRFERLSWLGNIYVWMIAWPLAILGPLFPESDSPDSNAPTIRMALFLVAILMDVLVYSVLTYVFLWRRARRNRLP